MDSMNVASTPVVTLIKMMNTLPEPVQEQVVDHLREYMEDLQDELRWDSLFKRTQPQLVTAARRAKQQIAEGKASPMDYDRL
jgi:hypothetical protein